MTGLLAVVLRTTTAHEGEGDMSYAELRLGAEFRYQKNLTMYLLFEHQQVFDGNLIDDRANSTNPGGTDVFGRAGSHGKPGLPRRALLDRLQVRRHAAAHARWGGPVELDQAGLVGDDDPRFALFGVWQLRRDGGRRDPVRIAAPRLGKRQ